MPAGGDKILAQDVTWPTSEQVDEPTDFAGITSSTPAMGSPVCGLTFVAPLSGRIMLNLAGGVRVTAGASGAAYLGAMLRTGAVIGSGTLVYDGANTEPGCRIFCGGGFLGYVGGGMCALIEGLTPAAVYNAYTVHFAASGGTVSIINRRVGVFPVP